MKNKNMRNAYKINKNIGVYLKQAGEPKGKFDEYRFQFSLDHQKELRILSKRYDKLFLSLICKKDRQICLLSYQDFLSMYKKRSELLGYKEVNFTVIVTAEKRKSFRVYANKPGTKGHFVEIKTINKNDFPKNLFMN